RHRKPENWLEAVAWYGHGISEQRELGIAEQASEALLMGLRLAEGIDLDGLSRRFGLAADDLLDPAKLRFHAANRLLWQDGSRIGVSEAGMPVLDALLGELVPGDLVRA